MMKTLILTLGLVLVAQIAAAEIFRCETLEGTLYLTNDPGLTPAGCSFQENPAPTRGGLSIVPGLKAGHDHRDYVATLTQIRERHRDVYQAYLQKAVVLVEEYQQTRRNRQKDHYMTDKRQAMRDLRVIKLQKQQIIQLAKTELSRRNLYKIEKILDDIPA